MRVQPPGVAKDGNRSCSVGCAALTAALIFITVVITAVILNKTYAGYFELEGDVHVAAKVGAVPLCSCTHV